VHTSDNIRTSSAAKSAQNLTTTKRLSQHETTQELAARPKSKEPAPLRTVLMTLGCPAEVERTGAAAHRIDEALGCPAEVERTGAAAHRVDEALGCPAEVERTGAAAHRVDDAWLPGRSRKSCTAQRVNLANHICAGTEALVRKKR